MQIFFNSVFTQESNALISPLSDGFMYGYGVFETVKIYNNRAIFLEDHYQRLKGSLVLLNLSVDYSSLEIADICEKLITVNKIENGFIKIVCSKGKTEKTDMIISTGGKVYAKEYERGFKLRTAGSKRNETSKLCYIKSLNYMDNIIQREIAAKSGFDEALFLNTKDYVCEGCISNIFWVKDKSVFTPSIQCGLLPGITRKKVLSLCNKLGIQTVEGEFCLNDIKNADEIFVTNSLMDIMPVSAFENRQIIISDSDLTNQLMRELRVLYY